MEWSNLLPIALSCAAVAAVFASPKHGKFVVGVGIIVSLMEFIVNFTPFIYSITHRTVDVASDVISWLSFLSMFCLLGVSLVLKGTGRHLPHSTIWITCLAAIFAVMYIIMPIKTYYFTYHVSDLAWLRYVAMELIQLVAFVLMFFSIDWMPACINKRKGSVYHTVFCEKCGSANKIGSKFCTTCGAKLEESNAVKSHSL